MSSSSVPHVLIVGGGFAGVYAAREFSRLHRQCEVRITLLSERNYFLFTPLLHEVATGGLSPTSVAEPLAEVFRDTCVTVITDTVVSLDRTKKIATTKNGQNIAYDYIIVASGSVSTTSLVSGAEKNALSLKNLADAVTIRRRTVKTFEAAVAAASRGDVPQLSFAVVGAGHTGVETVLELSDFVRNTLAPYYRRGLPPSTKIAVSLFGDTEEPVPHSSPAVRKAVARALEKNRVPFYGNRKVKAVADETLLFTDGKSIPAQLVVWAAGVRPALPPGWNIPRLGSGRIKTDSFLAVEGDASAYAVGDIAGTDPCLAQVAVQQGVSVAHIILSRIQKTEGEPFHFKSQGFLMSLGRGNAAGEILGFFISGPLAWWIWRTIYLFKFLSWRKRLHIALEWTLNLFTRREITAVLD